mmetsp:Transcript_16809/g.29525  ORF Transcript_16809/g.29525 Transcript_16809/m.29525 type:complete len:223 (-) Transcript_16809:593-1261(-)
MLLLEADPTVKLPWQRLGFLQGDDCNFSWRPILTHFHSKLARGEPSEVPSSKWYFGVGRPSDGRSLFCGGCEGRGAAIKWRGNCLDRGGARSRQRGCPCNGGWASRALQSSWATFPGRYKRLALQTADDRMSGFELLYLSFQSLRLQSLHLQSSLCPHGILHQCCLAIPVPEHFAKPTAVHRGLAMDLLLAELAAILALVPFSPPALMLSCYRHVLRWGKLL